MSFYLSFARHRSKILFLVSLEVLSSCARKNTRIYNFCSAQQPVTHRIDLPYLAQVRGGYDGAQQQCNLTWEPIPITAIPPGVSLYGYNVYVGTVLKLFGRQPLLRLTAQAHTCEFVLQRQFSLNPLFGVAPVFYDQQKNEIIGLVTVAKFL